MLSLPDHPEVSGTAPYELHDVYRALSALATEYVMTEQTIILFIKTKENRCSPVNTMGTAILFCSNCQRSNQIAQYYKLLV